MNFHSILNSKIYQIYRFVLILIEVGEVPRQLITNTKELFQCVCAVAEAVEWEVNCLCIGAQKSEREIQMY